MTTFLALTVLALIGAFTAVVSDRTVVPVASRNLTAGGEAGLDLGRMGYRRSPGGGGGLCRTAEDLQA